MDAVAAVSAAQDADQVRFELIPAERIAAERRQTHKFGARIVAYPDPDYPAPLREIPDPPPVLTIKGNAMLANAASVAIVGARNASAAGRRIAGELAGALGHARHVVVSGLARGIDGAAHEAALGTGTIAVLAGGIDQAYPPQHRDLYEAVAAQGLLMTEMPFGHVARARDFPKRNRIVSGLSRGVIIVEAAERSGTLITARMALEQGREVFAVPSSPLDPRGEGTNRLIRDGARLVRHADDVLEDLAIPTPRPVPADLFEGTDGQFMPAETLRSLRQDIIGLLGPTPTHRDELVRLTGATAAQVADALVDLTLDGVVSEEAGGTFVTL
jgi:DNA processing protein